jgi:lipopolysaccharide/colanic/teichoic acid biosynthesis glycosyltransferase
VKRWFDVTLVLLASPFWVPLLLVIALTIGLTMGRPVIFAQVRPGFRGNPFRLYKFRTMHEPRSEADRLSTDAERITSLGRFLRATSLDELPELWNVLRDEMSLVGPRPLLIDYLPLYSPEQARRHDMRPGLTGWAQVNGRNAISWEERFSLDIWYIDNWSLGLDLRILLRTLFKVIRREGISAEGQATMSRFTGSARE